MVWTPGQILQGGKYTIEKKLGQGGFGITYLARDKKGNPVVIKMIKEEDVDSFDFDKCQQDFVNEALKLKGCQHPHIVKVYELIKEGELWGMVMEYIEGEDLGSWRLPLPESEALLYIHQIGEALKVVHNNGFLHRDVKPNNIMIRADKPEAVLIDFGIARDFTLGVTQTHTTHLTVFYAPPEQYNHRAKRGAYTDVYALAATLYKLLTGKEPESAMSRGLGEPLKPPKKLNPNISDRVNQAILQGLELWPEMRPQSVQDWLALFESDHLSSAVGLDYRKLRDSLAAGNWKEADRETVAVMLKAFHREKKGMLECEDIDKFPCEDLRTIDQLWVKYSYGRFGFSVQKRIYDQCGRNEYKFGDLVGWRVNNKWLYPSDLTFNLQAPLGHLPGLRRGSHRRGGGLYLFSRVETCNL
ncbi:MAG: serine/threonine-protein kinase [Coleofasciculus sp. S288]|nr:serine/threonine-protein kinase [Coleofasciculus sp. S288]